LLLLLLLLCRGWCGLTTRSVVVLTTIHQARDEGRREEQERVSASDLPEQDPSQEVHHLRHLPRVVRHVHTLYLVCRVVSRPLTTINNQPTTTIDDNDRYLTYNDELSPQNPCFFCEKCYAPFHYAYDSRGTLLLNHDVFKYHHE
jgi:hypothetical protein